MSEYKVGDTDAWGYTLKRRRGPVDLWKTPKDKYVVYLYVKNEQVLHASRSRIDEAHILFESTCEMFPDLKLETEEKE